jgi:hypothetical protein
VKHKKDRLKSQEEISPGFFGEKRRGFLAHPHAGNKFGSPINNIIILIILFIGLGCLFY